MNSSDFEALMGNTFGNLTKLSASKGLEYSGETDRLANFKEQAKLLGFATPIQVLGVYLNKHLGSINKFISGLDKGLSEPIEGRIDDAILYLVLLKALIDEGRAPRLTLNQQIEINREKAMRDIVGGDSFNPMAYPTQIPGQPMRF